MPMYEAELLDEERDAVQNLLNYLDSGKFTDRCIHIWAMSFNISFDPLDSLDVFIRFKTKGIF